jgi:hypothetical protein
MITDSQLEQGRIVAIKALRTLVERDEWNPIEALDHVIIEYGLTPMEIVEFEKKVKEKYHDFI